MAIIGPTTPISARHRRITLQNRSGAPIPDGEGGYTQPWADLATGVDARIAPATQAALERLAAGTVITTATHVVTIPYLAGVSTSTRILIDGRALNITSVQDPEERHVELILVCEEAVS
jgi:SPP1 family predicted phage head-tail adaptor